MKRIVYITITIYLLFCFHVLAGEVIAKKSEHIKYGVRLYSGKLPPDIKYKLLGTVECETKGAYTSLMMIKQHNLSFENLLYEARKLGANAVINICYKDNKSSLTKIGEAVYVESFPDSFSEENFEKFKGPKEYEKSMTFQYPYETIFIAIEKILTDELYKLQMVDINRGVIETEPIEVSNGSNFPCQGPYPILKIIVTINSNGQKTTQVTEKYVFLKGRPIDKTYLIESNKRFFKDINKLSKKIEKPK